MLTVETERQGIGVSFLHKAGRTESAGDAHACAWRARVDELEAELHWLYTVAAFEDPDTHLGNAVQLRRELTRVIARFHRVASPFSIAVVEVETSAGTNLHPAVVEAVGKVLIKESRDEDTAARIGANRFAVVLVNCPVGGARQFAQRAVQRLGGMLVRADSAVQVLTAWGGVAEWGDASGSAEALISCAVDDLDQSAAAQGRVRRVFEGRTAEPSVA